MQTSDVRLIADLAEAVRNAAPVQKDPEAAQLIAQLIGSQPDALYFLVQTVLLQKEALAAPQATSAGAGAGYPAPAASPTSGEDGRGRWGGLFGPRRAPSPGYPSAPAAATGGGGSFLKTAAAGAAGVAGGVLLAQGISGLFAQPAHEGEHSAAASYDDSDWTDGGWDDV